MAKFMLVAGLLALGCGSSDGGSASVIEGIWSVSLQNGCLAEYNFTGSTYSSGLICDLAGGGSGLELEFGNFSTGNGEIDFVPTRTSCKADAEALSLMYYVNGDNLVLTQGSTQVIFVRTAKAAGAAPGGTIEDGCWLSDSSGQLSLEPHAVENL